VGSVMFIRYRLNTIKFHQLQLIRDTAMVTDYERHPEDFRFYQLDEYLQLMRCFVERLSPSIVIERFFAEAPPEMDVTPVRWNMRNDQLLQRFERLLELEDTWQGRLCASS
jgi:radical SAM superfamily enzyme